MFSQQAQQSLRFSTTSSHQSNEELQKLMNIDPKLYGKIFIYRSQFGSGSKLALQNWLPKIGPSKIGCPKLTLQNWVLQN